MDINNLREQIAELLIIRASGHLYDSQREYPLWELSNNAIQKLLIQGVGGIILLGGTTTEIQNRCQQFRRWSNKDLLLCADVEEGVGQRFSGGTFLPPPMSLGQIYKKDSRKAIHLAEQYGAAIGSQARKCGLNWVLGPVCDVNSNPNNPVINVRAWGEDPITVSNLVCSFHKGLSSEGVLSCAKHFPGHGDTAVDSHLELPLLDKNLDDLESLELLPFKSIVSEGVDSIMTAHLKLPSLDNTFPATLSPYILTNLLRERIGFDGIIVTDALIMKSISKAYGAGQAAVLAFEAGADLIMMPEEPYQAIEAIYQSITKNRIPIDRLKDSISRRKLAIEKNRKIISKLSLNSNCSSDKDIKTSDDKDLVKSIIRDSIEFRNLDNIGSDISGSINLLKVDKLIDNPNLKRLSPAINLLDNLGCKSIILHPLSINPWTEDWSNPLDLRLFGSSSFFLQLFIRGNPFVEKVNSERWPLVVKQLQRNKRLRGLVVYGSKYLWEDILRVLDRSIPAAYSPGQIEEVQEYILSKFIDQSSSSSIEDLEFTS